VAPRLARRNAVFLPLRWRSGQLVRILYDPFGRWNGSLLNLSGLSTFNGAAYSNGGVYAYSVSASNNGVVDLSKVTTLTGAQSDDWLQFSASMGERSSWTP